MAPEVVPIVNCFITEMTFLAMKKKRRRLLSTTPGMQTSASMLHYGIAVP